MNASPAKPRGGRYLVTAEKRDGQFGLRLALGNNGTVTVVESKNVDIPKGSRLVAVEGVLLSELALMRTYLLEVLDTRNRVVLLIDRALNCHQL